MFTLEITASAEEDLDSITDYLGFELSNPPAAMAFLDEVDRVGDELVEDPEMFPLCKDVRLADLGYRKATVRAYIMIYEIDYADQSIRILRFFHSSEDYANKL